MERADRCDAGHGKRRQRRWLVLLLLVLAPLFVFVSMAAYVVVQAGTNWDIPVLVYVADHQVHVVSRVVGVATEMGSVPVVCLLLAGVVVALLVARLHWEAAFLVVATTSSMVVDGIMKLVFARPRPTLFEQPPTGWSFPSGHTMSATGFAAALVILCWHTRWRLPVTIAAVLYAAFIGASRVYLSAHYPSDVVAGWALSLVVVGAVWLAFWDRLAEARAEPFPLLLSDGEAGLSRDVAEHGPSD
jgi:undecaprenyl-diphosphatase